MRSNIITMIATLDTEIAKLDGYYMYTTRVLQLKAVRQSLQYLLRYY